MEAGEIGFIKVYLESNKSIATLVTVNLFDADLTSIGIGSVKTTLSSGTSEIILSFMIPEDAAIGPADIYVNAFSDWPSTGGIPLTGEFSITEFIGNTNSPPVTIPEPEPTLLPTIIPTPTIQESALNSIVRTTDKGTVNVRLTYDEIEPDIQTKINIDFIDSQTDKTQAHVDYLLTVSKDSEPVFGSTHLIHTSEGFVKIPIEFNLGKGVYPMNIKVVGILFNLIPTETVSFNVLVWVVK